MPTEAHPATDELPEGWMGKRPSRWLQKRARKRSRIIEVGVWKGRTTALLARSAPWSARIWAVDNWRGTPDDEGQHALYSEQADETGDAVYYEFYKNLETPIQAGRVFPVRMDSVAAADHLLAQYGRTFDMVFLDADHRYEAVRADIVAYSRLLIPGGLLCGHDYSERWPGVVQAVDEFFPHRKKRSTIWSVKVG